MTTTAGTGTEGGSATGGSATGGSRTLECRNPVTGATVARFGVTSPAEVGAALERARVAAAWWRDLGFDGRRRRLLAVRASIARRAGEIAALMHAETGKPEAVAYTEVLIAGEHLSFAARHAGRVLGRRRVPSTLVTIGQAGSVEYEPLGVVGLITPWNYPLAIPVSDLASIVGAGNAVLLKPSEYATATGAWIVERFAEAIGEQPVVQLVPGDGVTGAALCRAGADKIAFTGSVAVGRAVARACAEELTPCSLELGGNDALVVDADADVDAAAEAAVFGAFANSGQLCISIERAYVADAVHDAFVERVAERLAGLRCGPDAADHLGPLTTPAQVETVTAHVVDALERGARAAVGGRDSIRPPYVEPIVLVDVPAGARLLSEETFGPVLAVVRAADADEAVALANAGDLGLGGAVFSRSRGVELARALRCGAVAVNSVLWFYAMGHLPFGGVGTSGWGVTHGADGLRNFARPKAISRQRLGFGRFSLDRLDLHPRVRAAMPLIARALHGHAPRPRR